MQLLIMHTFRESASEKTPRDVPTETIDITRPIIRSTGLTEE